MPTDLTLPTAETRLATGKLPGPLLDHLIEAYRTAPDPAVIVTPGYGRDAAAIMATGSTPLVVKSDPITFASAAASRYLVAVNANDVACLGGIPRWLSVVLLLPEHETTAEMVESHFAELQAACDETGIAVIGGHTEVTSAVTRPVLVGTMIGTVGEQGLIEPGRSEPGDELLLTRWIGIEGTALLARERASDLEKALSPEIVSRAAKLLRSPGISVVRDVRVVLGAPGVTGLHDPTEGGIATAIHEMASACRCGAEVLTEAMPVLPETTEICRHFGIDPWGLLSSGALLVAVSRDRLADVTSAAGAASVPIAHIGRLVDRADGVTVIGPAGRKPLPRFDADEVTRVL